VRRLIATSLFARLPLGISLLAIVLFVRRETGSFALAGAAGGAYTLAGAASAPVQGAIVDRHGQRLTLLPMAVLQSLLFCVLVAAGTADAPGWSLVALSVITGAALPPLAAGLRVLWPVVVQSPEDRERAYALDAMSQEVIWTAGPLLVALAVAAASPAAAVLLSAALTLVGTAVYVSSPVVRAWRGREAPRSRHGALASKGLPLLLVTIFLSGIAVGGLELGLPALAVHLGTSSGAGVLLALWGFGSMCGGIWYGRRGWQSDVAARYVATLVLAAVVALPLLGAATFLVGVVLAFVAGIAWAPLHSCQFALVGRIALPGTAAEAFTWNIAALVGGIAAGSALAGPLVDGVAVGAAFVLAALASSAAAALAGFVYLTSKSGSYSVTEPR